jgi:uncharacterized protein (DUF2062 family)
MKAILGAVVIGMIGAILVVGLGLWFLERTKRARFRSEYLARSRTHSRSR